MGVTNRTSLQYADTASLEFSQFYGLDLSRDAAFVGQGFSPDALNMDTSYGNLAVRPATLPFFPPAVSDHTPRIQRTHFLEVNGKEALVFSTAAQVAGQSPGIYITTAALPAPDADAATIAAPTTFKLWALDTTPALPAANTATQFRLNSIAPYHMGTDRADVVLLFSVSAFSAGGILPAQSGLFLFELTDDPADYQSATRLIPAPTSSDPNALFDYEMGKSVSHFTIAFGRMFAVKAAGSGDARSNRVYYSRTGEPDVWENVVDDELSGGYVDIGQDDGGRIVDIRTIYSEVVVFKTNGVYRIVGDRPSNFQILRIDDCVRCLSSECGLPTRAGYLVLCDDGLYRYTGNAMEYLAQSDTLRPVWAALQGRELSLFDPAAPPPHLAFCGNTLYITLAADQPVYEYDLLRATFMASQYRGVNLFDLFAYKGALVASSAGGYVRLRHAQLPQDTVYQWQTGAQTPATQALVQVDMPITARWRTPDIDLGEKDVGKIPQTLHLCGCGATSADTAAAKFPFLFVTVAAKGKGTRVRTKRRGVDATVAPTEKPCHFRLRLHTKGRSFYILFENAWSQLIPTASSYFELASGMNMRLELDGN